MAKLKIPSLQHLARLWQSDPQLVKSGLLALADNAPPFSYSQLFDLLRDMLQFNIPYEQIVRGVRREIKLELARDNYLEILPLAHEQFRKIKPNFVHAVARRYYPIGRGLVVPFDPPLIYGARGELCFPWFSFWKTNPLRGEQLSLFATVVKEVLEQDAELDEARFEIFDFSAPSAKDSRNLTIINAAEIPRLPEKRKLEMLSIFAEGYSLAADEYLNKKEKERSIEGQIDRDKGQLGLFD